MRIRVGHSIPERQEQHPVREGEWVCSGCGVHNYESRTVCRQCSAPKKETGSVRNLKQQFHQGSGKVGGSNGTKHVWV